MSNAVDKYGDDPEWLEAYEEMSNRLQHLENLDEEGQHEVVTEALELGISHAEIAELAEMTEEEIEEIEEWSEEYVYDPDGDEADPNF